MFYEGDIQSGIGLAVQQSKAVLCFVYDDTETTAEWEEVLRDASISPALDSQTIALRLKAGSPEAGFLAPITAVNTTPAIIVIKNARVQENLQSAQISTKDLKRRLSTVFGVDVEEGHEPGESEWPPKPEQSSGPEHLDLPPPAAGEMRLPNNAYEALRTHTQKLLDEGSSSSDVFETQMTLLSNMSFHEEVALLRDSPRRVLSDLTRRRLMSLPAMKLETSGLNKSSQSSQTPAQTVASNTEARASRRESESARAPAPAQAPVSASPSVPVPAPVSIPSSQSRRTVPPPTQSGASPDTSSLENEKTKSQRLEYIKMQREREQRQRDERERIKAQIKADRDERRRLDEMRKHGELDLPTGSTTNSTSTSYARSKATNAEVRVQIRTFDGSTLRNTFPQSSSLVGAIRPWIDSSTNSTMPYNLKLILTPLPNRTIEAGEEEQDLADLGIRGSCTFVMVPVRGYVDSYTDSSTSGLLGGVVNGGYNLVSGAAGMVFGGVKSLLGYNNPEPTLGSSTSSTGMGDGVGRETLAAQSMPGVSTAPNNVRIRTLADQRAEAARDQQFYNGNQLNFEPKRDDEDKSD